MINLFENISNYNKQKLLALFEANVILCHKNEVLQTTIKKENFIAVVESGYLQIIKTNYNGQTLVIDELEENMIFGNSVSSISSNEYEIIAKEDSKVIVLDFDRIININVNLTAYNIFIKNLLIIMDEKIKKSNERMEILTNKTIRNKLLEYFKINSRGNNSRIIYLPFTFSALADFLAIDRCAMSREISNLKDEGLIEVKGKRIKLLYYPN